MSKFGTRENFIEAVQFNKHNLEECLEFCEGHLKDVENFENGTLIGRLFGKEVLSDEYIIKTNEHELLIMNDDLFECLFVEY